MKLTEMFNICETCVYAPCFCGNEPENCVNTVVTENISATRRVSNDKRNSEVSE